MLGGFQLELLFQFKKKSPTTENFYIFILGKF